MASLKRFIWFGIVVSLSLALSSCVKFLKLAEEVERVLQTMQANLKVAVMGCVVNGPGEAKEADIGVAGGHGTGIIFKKGVVFKKLHEAELLPAFLEELRKMDAEAS